MSHEDFDAFMKEALEKFKNQVATDPNYQFARDGEKMPLGDWFEQFAMRMELI
jgi:hypothetical protein